MSKVGTIKHTISVDDSKFRKSLHETAARLDFHSINVKKASPWMISLMKRRRDIAIMAQHGVLERVNGFE